MRVKDKKLSTLYHGYDTYTISGGNVPSDAPQWVISMLRKSGLLEDSEERSVLEATGEAQSATRLGAGKEEENGS